MKTISSIRWTEQAIEHIGRHGITPFEIEEACFSVQEAAFIRSGRDCLHYVFGRTDAGRYLFIVVKYERPGQVSVITARDMNAWKNDIFKAGGNKMKNIPAFKSDEQAAKFWETHSFEDYRKDSRESGIRFVKRAKRTVALRLDPDDIQAVEKIAEGKGLSYTALLRMWIKEHLSQEAK